MSTTPYPVPRSTRQTDILVGNGGTVYGPFDGLQIFDNEDVVVYSRATTDVPFSAVDVTVAKVSGLSFDFFTIEFAQSVPETTQFIVASERLPERSAGVKKGTMLDMTALEKELSKVATTDQELRRDVGRALKVGFGQELQDLPIPDGVSLLGWDKEGKLVNRQTDGISLAEAQAAAEAALAAANAGFVFDTEAEFLAANIPANLDFVRTAGYHVPGDWGGHTKVRSTAVDVFAKQSADGSWWRLSEKSINLVMFGGKRDYVTNSRAAYLTAIAFAQAYNVPILDLGVYGIEGSVEIANKPVTIQGLVGAPNLHYQTRDDKIWLRRGVDANGILYKAQMPGLVFVFKNGGPVTELALANMTDEYATVKPSLIVSANFCTFRSFAVVQDNDCFDEADVFLPLGQENSADDFDVGIFVKDSAQNEFWDVVEWGYFDKAGVAVWSTDGNDDPDYNRFYGGSVYGRHGLALLGASLGQVGGLSGTQVFGTILGSKDHNSRVADVGGLTVADYYATADAEKWRCLYISGDVNSNTADLAGHMFIGATIRTAVNNPVELGFCSSVKFIGGVHEVNPYGVAGSNSIKWLATQATIRGVVIEEMRFADLNVLFHANFAGVIPFKIKGGISGNKSDIISVPDPNVAGTWSFVKIGTDRGAGDISLQFSKDISSENNGFVLGLDVSEGNFKLWQAGTELLRATADNALSFRRHADQDGSALTIAAGVIAVTHGAHSLNGEGGAADDLVTINGGALTNQRLVLRRGNADITVKHSVGNIRCGADRVLNSSLDRIELEYNGTLWVMVSYADNA